MGNYKFRLSDMMPNAWFYKLKDMARTTKNHRHHHIDSAAAHTVKKKQAKRQQQNLSQPKKPHHHSYPRESYYFTRDLISNDPKSFSNSPTKAKSSDTLFPDPPRKSSKHQQTLGKTYSNTSRKSSPKKTISSSVSAGCSCRAATPWTQPDSPPDYSASPSPDTDFPPEFRSDRFLATDSYDEMISRSSSNASKFDSSANDIVIDVDKKSLPKKTGDNLDVFGDISELNLPPIVTKPNEKIECTNAKETNEPKNYRNSCSDKPQKKASHGSLSLKIVKEHDKNDSVSMKEQKGISGSITRHSGSPHGVKLRTNSPRIGGRRITATGRGRRSASSSRRGLSESSLAVVKKSFDPQKDFRDSMVEMIVENNIRASKDLEELLACYLSLNSDEYHELIIKVFKQIWFDLSDAKLK